MNSFDLGPVLRRILVAALASGAAHALTACAISLEPEEADGAIPSHDAGVADDSVCTTSTDPNAMCTATVTYACGTPAGIVPGGTISSDTCTTQCPRRDAGTNAFGCYASSGDGGTVVLNCNYCRGTGRRTEGLRDPSAFFPGNALGTYLANAATLEAASVIAFERLRDELRAFGAPQSLLDALDVAAREEIDHAERMTAAARRFGAEPDAPRVESIRPRTLFEIARENAVEGCARETLGALVIAWQGERAADRGLATMFARIARDEASHASLAWRTHAWLLEQLRDDERLEVEAERDRAVDEMFASAESATDGETARVAGVPDAATLRDLLESLRREVWSATRD